MVTAEVKKEEMEEFLWKLHTMGWVVFLILLWLYCITVVGAHRMNRWDLLITEFFGIGVFYFNIFCLFPRVLGKRFCMYRSSLVLVLELVLIVVLFVALSLASGALEWRAWPADAKLLSLPSNFFFLMLPLWVTPVISVFYFALVGEGRFQIKRESQEAVIARQETLKVELAPHFYNNFASFVEHKIEREPALAKKANRLMNELMVYSLNIRGKDLVLVSEELKHLDVFIKLCALLWKEKRFLNVVVDGDFSTSLVLPKLLILLADNMYKYGVLDDPNRPAELSIRLIGEEVLISAQNRIASNKSSFSSTGMGLKNIQERLRLSYRNDHLFLVGNTGTEFKVEIRMGSVSFFS